MVEYAERYRQEGDVLLQEHYSKDTIWSDLYGVVLQSAGYGFMFHVSLHYQKSDVLLQEQHSKDAIWSDSYGVVLQSTSFMFHVFYTLH